MPLPPPLQVLRSLALSNNSLGNKAAEAFGELLPGNRTLTHLDLSWNMIKVRSISGSRARETDEGLLRTQAEDSDSSPSLLMRLRLRVRIPFLSHLPQIPNFPLIVPPLQFEGVSKLCAGVEENGSLKRLNLSWNGLETAGCQRVGKV